MLNKEECEHIFRIHTIKDPLEKMEAYRLAGYIGKVRNNVADKIVRTIIIKVRKSQQL